jgi:hypothetical protein
MSASDFSPGHRALPRIFANPKESQLAEITQLLFQSGSYAAAPILWSALISVAVASFGANSHAAADAFDF